MSADIVTDSVILLNWEVPTIVQNTERATVDGFNVTYRRSGDDGSLSVDVPDNSTAAAITLLEPDRVYLFFVSATYTYSNGTLDSSTVMNTSRTQAAGEKQVWVIMWIWVYTLL